MIERPFAGSLSLSVSPALSFVNADGHNVIELGVVSCWVAPR